MRKISKQRKSIRYIRSVCTFITRMTKTRAMGSTASGSRGRSSQGTLAQTHSESMDRCVSGNTWKSGSSAKLREKKKAKKRQGQREQPTSADFNFSYKGGKERKRTKRGRKRTGKERKRKEGEESRGRLSKATK